MNVLKTVFVFLICSSVYGQPKNDKSTITVTEPKSTNVKIPKTWKNLNAFQKEWIKIEQDENGYLIYDPCDGATPTIKFDQTNLNINSGLESETFNTQKPTILTDKKSFMLDAYNTESKTWFQVKARIVDNKKGIVLWEFSGVKWLMTPMENADKFRTIKNNCTGKKKKELKFLPVSGFDQ